MSDRAARTQESGETKPRPRRRRTGPLSKREREVFELLAEGLNGARIAERLVLSPDTVRTHIRNGMAKLGASTRSQALVIALRRQEISPGAEPSRDTTPAPPRRTAGAHEVTAALELVMDGLLRLWDVDAGWVYLTEDDGLTLKQVVQRVGESEDALPASIALGEGALGTVALERRSRVLHTSGAETGAMIAAPLIDDGRLIGVLGVAIRPSRATGRKELLLLQALAARIAELVAGGGPRLSVDAEQALAGFRSSWTASTRPV